MGEAAASGWKAVEAATLRMLSSGKGTEPSSNSTFCQEGPHRTFPLAEKSHPLFP